jgi:predicted 3-demethylubiquinone-9 3-methyltransferase (glyoxalase superfamily)
MRFMMFMIPRVHQPDTPPEERAQEGFAPPAEAVARMTRYNDELAQTGALLPLDGLHPSAKGARVAFSDGCTTVTDGPLTEAISFVVSCETREEIDELWDKLSEGGTKVQCGWLKDWCGGSWQIVPTVLGVLVGDADPERSNRVMQAMLRMEKLDIAALRQAYEQA